MKKTEKRYRTINSEEDTPLITNLTITANIDSLLLIDNPPNGDTKGWKEYTDNLLKLARQLEENNQKVPINHPSLIIVPSIEEFALRFEQNPQEFDALGGIKKIRQTLILANPHRITLPREKKNSSSQLQIASDSVVALIMFLKALAKYNKNPNNQESKSNLESSANNLYFNEIEIGIISLNAQPRDDISDLEEDTEMLTIKANCDRLFEGLSNKDRIGKATFVKEIIFDLKIAITKKLEGNYDLKDPVILGLFQTLEAEFEAIENENSFGINEVKLAIDKILEKKEEEEKGILEYIKKGISKELEVYCHKNPSFLLKLTSFATGLNESQNRELFFSDPKIKDAQYKLEKSEELKKELKQEYDKAFRGQRNAELNIMINLVESGEQTPEEEESILEQKKILFQSIGKGIEKVDEDIKDIQQRLNESAFNALETIFKTISRTKQESLLEQLKMASQALEISNKFPKRVYLEGDYQSSLNTIEIIGSNEFKVVALVTKLEGQEDEPLKSFITDTTVRYNDNDGSIESIDRKIILPSGKKGKFPYLLEPEKPSLISSKFRAPYEKPTLPLPEKPKKLRITRGFTKKRSPIASTLDIEPSPNPIKQSHFPLAIFSNLPTISETEEGLLNSFKKISEDARRLAVRSLENTNIAKTEIFFEFFKAQLKEFTLKQEILAPEDKEGWKNFDKNFINLLKKLIVDRLSPLTKEQINQIVSDEMEDFSSMELFPLDILRNIKDELLKTIINTSDPRLLHQKESSNYLEINKKFLENNLALWQSKTDLAINILQQIEEHLFNRGMRSLAQFEIDYPRLLSNKVLRLEFLKIIKSIGLDQSVVKNFLINKSIIPSEIPSETARLPGFNISSTIEQIDKPFSKILIEMCNGDKKKEELVMWLMTNFNQSGIMALNIPFVELSKALNTSTQFDIINDYSNLKVNLDQSGTFFEVTIINFCKQIDPKYEGNPIGILGTSAIISNTGEILFIASEAKFLTEFKEFSEKLPNSQIIKTKSFQNEKNFFEKEAKELSEELKKQIKKLSEPSQSLSLKLLNFENQAVPSKVYFENNKFSVKDFVDLKLFFTKLIRSRTNECSIALELTKNFPEELLETFFLFLEKLDKNELQILRGISPNINCSRLNAETIINRTEIEKQIKFLKKEPNELLSIEHLEDIRKMLVEQQQLSNIDSSINSNFREILGLMQKTRLIEEESKQKQEKKNRDIFLLQGLINFGSTQDYIPLSPDQMFLAPEEMEEIYKIQKIIFHKLLELRETVIRLDRNNNITITANNMAVLLPNYYDILHDLGLNEENAERMAKIFGDFEEKALQSIYPEIQFEDLFSRKRKSDKLEEEENSNNNNNKRIRTERNQDIETKSESGSEGKEEAKGEEATAKARENERMEREREREEKERERKQTEEGEKVDFPTNSPRTQSQQSEKLTDQDPQKDNCRMS